jgi:hypothetical protein
MLHKRLTPIDSLSDFDKNPLEPFLNSSKITNLEDLEIKKRTITDLTSITDIAFDSDFINKKSTSHQEFVEILSKELSLKLNTKKELYGLSIDEFTEHITQISLNIESSNTFERNLILEYSLRTRELHELQKRINYSYCANNCHYAPIGCCSTNCYETGIIPEMRKLQKIEAVYNGLDSKMTKKDKKFCFYHSEEKGCRILLFKSPPAFRYFCKPLQNDLKKRFGLKAENFYEPLTNMRPPDLGTDPKRVLKCMDTAIINGKSLLLYDKN